MTAPRYPVPPADVIAAIERAEALLKAVRPLLKAKKVDWHKVWQVLRMADGEISEPASAIVDWDIKQMRGARERDE